jgi:hypothetical protein
MIMKNSIAGYLNDYLMNENSVEVSGLGCFSTQTVGASVHPVLNEFTPPHSLLLFEDNRECQTTEGFTEYLAERLAVSHEQVSHHVEDFVRDIKDTLKSEPVCPVEGLGVFKMNKDLSFRFDADEELFLKPDNFGFPVFSLPHKTTVATVSLSEQNTEAAKSGLPNQPHMAENVKQEKSSEGPVKHKMKKKRRAFVWIFLILIISAGLTTVYFSEYRDVIISKVEKLFGKDAEFVADVKPQVEQQIEVDAEKENTETLIAEPEEVVLVAEEPLKYFVVAACFQNHDLAEKRVKELRKEGYNADIPGKTQKGLHIVTYNGFSVKTEAEAELSRIKKTVNKNTWLYTR